MPPQAPQLAADETATHDHLLKTRRLSRLRAQMLAFSATFSDSALGALGSLMPDAQRIFLAPDTISLLGVQQFHVTLPGGASLPARRLHQTDHMSTAGTDPAAGWLALHGSPMCLQDESVMSVWYFGTATSCVIKPAMCRSWAHLERQGLPGRWGPLTARTVASLAVSWSSAPAAGSRGLLGHLTHDWQ